MLWVYFWPWSDGASAVTKDVGYGRRQRLSASVDGSREEVATEATEASGAGVYFSPGGICTKPLTGTGGEPDERQMAGFYSLRLSEMKTRS